MTNVQEQSNRIKSLMNSVDKKDIYHYKIVMDKIAQEIIDDEEYENLTLNVLTTTTCWPDGAPVIKTFFRQNKDQKLFTFEQDKTYHVAHSGRGIVYWFYEGVWYLSEEDYLIRILFQSPE